MHFRFAWIWFSLVLAIKMRPESQRRLKLIFKLIILHFGSYTAYTLSTLSAVGWINVYALCLYKQYCASLWNRWWISTEIHKRKKHIPALGDFAFCEQLVFFSSKNRFKKKKLSQLSTAVNLFLCNKHIPAITLTWNMEGISRAKQEKRLQDNNPRHSSPIHCVNQTYRNNA